ncbi:MAG: S9 family peptidase [Bdellovibrionales bacterium]
MNRPHARVLFALGPVTLVCAMTLGACQMNVAKKNSSTTFDFPKPEKKVVVLEKHQDKREDPYFWMRERENPQVLEHLKAENKASDQYFKIHESTIEKLFQELKSRTAEDDQSVPIRKGDYEYWSRVVRGKEHALYLRKRIGTTQDETLLDENELAKGHDFLETTGPRISPNQELMAYGVDTQGRRFFTFSFKNLKTGQVLPMKIENITSSVAWANDNQTLFYVRQDPETLRAYQLYRFHLPTGKSDLVYQENDPEYGVYVSKSISQKFILMNVAHLQTSEVYFLDADKPNDTFKLLRKRKKGVQDSLVDGGTGFYLLTNEEAKNYKILSIPYSAVKAPSRWKTIQSASKNIYIDSVEALQGHLLINERVQGLDQIKVVDMKTLRSRYVKFEDQAYAAELTVAGDFDQKAFRMTYTSLRIPERTLEVDLDTLSLRTLKEQPVPNFSSDHYRTERVFIKSRDGVQIPVSLVMRKDLKLQGQNPLYVYGYGSYGMGMKPWFSLNALSLADRGFVYAIAHVRGGNEMGRDWYDQGRMKSKMNTFYDFIDVTEGLLKKGYGRKGHVYAEGGSAGGLLMGAVANLRPDLYHGMIADVPFVDVLTTMLDDTIPLTTFEYEEWGNPNIKAQYNWMRAYSPYDQVKAQAYPNMLIRTGLHDSQVQYWEPAKWAAKLRDFNTGPHRIFLNVNMDAGHGGASGRYKRLKEEAQAIAFVLDLENKGGNP